MCKTTVMMSYTLHQAMSFEHVTDRLYILIYVFSVRLLLTGCSIKIKLLALPLFILMRSWSWTEPVDLSNSG